MKYLLVLMLAACAPSPSPTYVSLKGDTGDRGASGADGRDGVDGVDATPVTIIPLCPGVSDHSVFVEDAICINGKLYGIYSSTATLVYLADGSYTSTSINSSCNLTVIGCTVTN